jgi:CheY-like chemotaxis protein
MLFAVEGEVMTPALPILFADHREEVFNILKEQLETTNYIVLHARSGEEAIALLERLKSKIVLAIIDLDLPGQSGWDLIGRLTLHDRKPLKIVATTSVYSKPALDKMKELGVNAVVRKPIRNEEWRTTVEAVMAEG